MTRSPPRLGALATAFAGAHAADQIALAALPLIAALALGADATTIGALVAAQGAAWLIVALPAGVLVDRWPRRRLLVLGPLGAAAGLTAAAAAPGPALLAPLVFAAAGGVVLAVLAAFAALPSLVARADLPGTNARLELGRAVATLAGPPLAGLCAGAGAPRAALLLAALAALGAGLAARAVRLPETPPAAARPPLARAIAEGARFVALHPLLRGIALCAVLFNLAFAVQLAALVPFALGPLGLSPQQAGLGAGAYGAGLILAALAAGAVTRRVAPGPLLVFGPSLPAACFVLAGLAPPPPLAGAGLALLAGLQFSLGFGPILWNVTRTSLQQAVAPPEALGRIGALMQVAVFGARPIGALLGGWVTAAYGPRPAMALAAAGFVLSVAAVLGSPLPRLRALPAPAAGAAG